LIFPSVTERHKSLDPYSKNLAQRLLLSSQTQN
jgi:hypothetical protein